MSSIKKRYRLLNQSSIDSTIKNRNSWTFTIAALGMIGTICFLLITGKVQIDSATLLSLILAFFSIYLSAAFYFKSTDQSNDFYDRSFNHTRDIANSLADMKASFTKSLEFIEKNNDEIRTKVENLPGLLLDKQEKKEDVEEEYKQSVESVLQKYGIKEEDLQDLINKRLEVEKLNNEIKRLKNIEYFNQDKYKNYNKLLNDYLSDLNESSESVSENILNEFIEKNFDKLTKSNSDTINTLFRNFLSRSFLLENERSKIAKQRALLKNAYIDLDSNLTKKSIDYIRNSLQ
ncbi:hypothetical protein [Pseudobacillus wudalianchiensis]|uniref:Uncharacterized protein n=1 Tax=Pseudobacillus wudalianchiensis TaxID=1743143 RepID=A0A1B9AU39_9BACI|nr:hypothetical protein [Bacillus wudalianchiensis]OCA87309.1 hypothetical protein A8F95_08665 [Bacillus wudalianchiensis]